MKREREKESLSYEMSRPLTRRKGILNAAAASGSDKKETRKTSREQGREIGGKPVLKKTLKKVEEQGI